jgi:hypothetical protein
MIRTFALAAVVAAAGSASAQFFSDEASFNAQLASSFTEDFSGIPTGLVDMPLSFSGNGFGFSVEAVDSPVDGNLLNDGLFNDPGLLSTNSATDGMQFTFSGPVQAVGGNIFSSDINFAAQPLVISLNFSDGGSDSFVTNGSSDFIGYVSASNITSLFIDALDAVDPIFGNTPNWVAVDSLTVGSRIPAPASAFALLGLAAARRRRA